MVLRIAASKKKKKNWLKRPAIYGYQYVQIFERSKAFIKQKNIASDDGSL